MSPPASPTVSCCLRSDILIGIGDRPTVRAADRSSSAMVTRRRGMRRHRLERQLFRRPIWPPVREHFSRPRVGGPPYRHWASAADQCAVRSAGRAAAPRWLAAMWRGAFIAGTRRGLGSPQKRARLAVVVSAGISLRAMSQAAGPHSRFCGDLGLRVARALKCSP